MKSKTLNMKISIFSIVIITFICVLISSCNPVTTPQTTDKRSTLRQATVDMVRTLPSRYEVPGYMAYGIPDSARQEGWFDVNEYFTVLTSLSVKPGYTLDYVYHNIGGEDAYPVIYARPVDGKPASSLDELSEIYNPGGESGQGGGYLSYLETDDTEKSYFDYVVLDIMGSQFYLWWHANRHDTTIICDRDGLNAIWDGPYFKDGTLTIPADVKAKAEKLDLSPRVVLGRDTAEVRVVVFTKWGGFIEKIYTIKRTSPHTVLDIKSNTLVEWESSLRF